MSKKENKQFSMVVDATQLELENRSNMERHQYGLKCAAKEKVINHNTDVLLHYLKHPELLIRINKLVYAVMNFFFPIQENLEGVEDMRPIHYTGVAPRQHSKQHTVKKDNVVYLSREYRNIE